jgi:hypothetical protein
VGISLQNANAYICGHNTANYFCTSSSFLEANKSSKKRMKIHLIWRKELKGLQEMFEGTYKA